MKRFLSIFISLIMIMGVTSACSIGSTSKTESNSSSESVANDNATKKITLSFMSWTTDQDAIEAIIKEYEQQNPNVKIKATFNSTDDHKRNLKIAASSKTLPDMWRNWGGSLGSYYPENGLSYDLTEYAAKHDWKDKFTPTALKLATLGGQLSGYPILVTGMGIFYRKDMFKKYGIEVPQTFEDFEKAMATLKSHGIIPISTAGKYGWHVMRLLEELLEMYCGSETHDKLLALDADWSQESVVQAFAKFKEWIDKGYFPQGFLTMDPNDTKLLLYSNKAAMDIQGQWYESVLKEDGQDISKYGFFKMPLKEGANRMSANGEMIQFNANLSNEKLDECMKFLDYMYSPEVASTHKLQQPIPRKDNELPKDAVLLPQVFDAMNKYGTFTIADQGLPQEVVSKLFEAQDSIALGKMTPKQAAEFMQQVAEEYKSSNK